MTDDSRQGTDLQLFTARIRVTLRKGVLDPQGKTILHSLHTLGFPGVQDVRFGKYIRVVLEAADEGEAEESVREMRGKLLANPVIEDFQIEISPRAGGRP